MQRWTRRNTRDAILIALACFVLPLPLLRIPYWPGFGTGATASLALHFGASDVNGTLEDEKIAHMAQAASPAGLATEQILRIVRDAGKIPVERDALYNVVKVWS